MASDAGKSDVSLAFSHFRKTRMCSYYAAGSCVYGDSCNFAHGRGELLDTVNLAKTSLCQAFLVRQCPLWSRDCPFAHGKVELRRVMPDHGVPVAGRKKGRLRGSCKSKHAPPAAQGDPPPPPPPLDGDTTCPEEPVPPTQDMSPTALRRHQQVQAILQRSVGQPCPAVWGTPAPSQGADIERLRPRGEGIDDEVRRGLQALDLASNDDIHSIRARSTSTAQASTTTSLPSYPLYESEEISEGGTGTPSPQATDQGKWEDPAPVSSGSEDQAACGDAQAAASNGLAACRRAGPEASEAAPSFLPACGEARKEDRPHKGVAPGSKAATPPMFIWQNRLYMGSIEEVLREAQPEVYED